MLVFQFNILRADERGIGDQPVDKMLRIGPNHPFHYTIPWTCHSNVSPYHTYSLPSVTYIVRPVEWFERIFFQRSNPILMRKTAEAIAEDNVILTSSPRDVIQFDALVVLL